MPEIHDPEYYELAKYYDLIMSKHVPYKKHFAFLEEAFEKYQKKVQRILDLACGTGIHSLCFAKNGYNVVGVDVSSEMLDIARQKAKEEGLQAEFLKNDIRDLHFNKEFDAALCINQSVMCCMTHSNINNLITGVKSALKEGGIFIVDFLSIYHAERSIGKEWVESGDVFKRILKD